MNVPIREWLIQNGAFIAVFFMVGSLSVVCLTYLISQRRIRKRVLGELFQDRQHLDGNQYYQTYFASSDIPEEIVLTVTQILEDETGLDFSRVLPDEPLNGPISNILDGMDLVESVMRLEYEFKITITDAEAEDAKTPRQVMELVNAKLNSRN